MLRIVRSSLQGAMARADAWANRLYGWRWNPLYQSGSIVILTLVLMLATGLYLLLFYRIGSPFESVARVTDQVWAGRWIRSLHRYAADLALVAAAVHALRMFLQGRSWGPRALAWLSGWFLVFLLYVCGWTGYVMVWDTHGQLLAVSGAGLLDSIPIFSERIVRAFTGEASLPSAFFFLNLFLHIAVPIGLCGALWVHISRIARPVLWPPKGLAWGCTALLLFVSVVWPVPMYERADLLGLSDTTTVDVFYSFWLPAAEAWGPGAVWALAAAATVLVVSIPLWTRPRATVRPGPSQVEARYCTGCEQCYVDCPYEAIQMIPRPDGRTGLVAAVDPALCVSCGICAGSCAPMGIGPPERGGRDQLEEVQAFIEARAVGSADIVVVACDRGALPAERDDSNGKGRTLVAPVTCVGNLHTSVIEYLVRSGAGGVMVAGCPPRDCWSREGPMWLDERVYNDREAELQPRVDRRRVRVVHYGAAEGALLSESVAVFRDELRRLDEASPEDGILIDLECEVPAEEPA